MLMTLLGRTGPDLPAELLFSGSETEVLQACAKKTDSTNRLGWAMPYASQADSAAISGVQAMRRQTTRSCGWTMQNCSLFAEVCLCEIALRIRKVNSGRGQSLLARLRTRQVKKSAVRRPALR